MEIIKSVIKLISYEADAAKSSSHCNFSAIDKDD